MNIDRGDQVVESAERIENMRLAWDGRTWPKYDRTVRPDPRYLVVCRDVVRITPAERRERKREQDRQSKERARARPHDATAVAVWLGANTVLRLAREWRTGAHIARRSLEAAEHAGLIARVGDGTWIAGAPT